jgi:hypothetical protein
MILKIIFALIAFVILVYCLSRIQMKAWLDELDIKLKDYFPKMKNDGDTQDK